MDLWFQHQRGSVLGIYVLATSVGTYLGPMIAGYIADSSLGWRWIGYLGAIISGSTFLVLLFGLEETAFHRDRYVSNDGDRYLIDGVRNSTVSAGLEEGPLSFGVSVFWGPKVKGEEIAGTSGALTDASKENGDDETAGGVGFSVDLVSVSNANGRDFGAGLSSVFTAEGGGPNENGAGVGADSFAAVGAGNENGDETAGAVPKIDGVGPPNKLDFFSSTGAAGPKVGGTPNKL